MATREMSPWIVVGGVSADFADHAMSARRGRRLTPAAPTLVRAVGATRRMRQMKRERTRPGGWGFPRVACHSLPQDPASVGRVDIGERLQKRPLMSQGSSALYWRSPYMWSIGSSRILARRARACSQCTRASSTRTRTECVTSPGGRHAVVADIADNYRAAFADVHLRAVSSPICRRSTKPNASLSQLTAARTSG